MTFYYTILYVSACLCVCLWICTTILPPSLSPSVHQDNETYYGPASLGISCSCASPSLSPRLHPDECPDTVWRHLFQAAQLGTLFICESPSMLYVQYIEIPIMCRVEFMAYKCIEIMCRVEFIHTYTTHTHTHTHTHTQYSMYSA